jgi:hypothetical protein
MAFVAPLALAAGMSAATATWVSVGVSVAMLVGSWLYSRSNQQKNDVFDAGAQEMPRFNQALRGSTMPVLFGTNRVPSNIVWTKNFRTIRNETEQGGGGKFGGSGFMSKTPAGGGEVSYEYKWDLLFHIGMTPEPYNLFGGWAGSDRLSDSTIQAISNGGDGLDDILFLNPTDRPSNAALRFDEAFYSPGPRTGDTSFTPWAYFTAQEGTEHWFPNTAYVGFKQLSLGGQPAIPQLTWEIGPGELVMTLDTEYLADSAMTVDRRLSGAGYVTGDNDKHYVVMSDGVTSNTLIQCLEDGTQITLSETTLENALSGKTWTTWNNNVQSSASLSINILAGTIKASAIHSHNYILAHGISASGNVGNTFGLFKINSSGALEIQGGFFCGGTGTSTQTTDHVACGVSNTQTVNDPILLCTQTVASTDNHLMWCLPSIADMLTYFAQTDSDRDNELTLDLKPLYGGDGIFVSNSYYPDGSSETPKGWFLPYNGDTRYYMLIPKAMAQYYINNGGGNTFINNNAASYPNGFLCYLDLASVVFPLDDVDFTIIATAPVIDNSLLENFPFSDACLRSDEETVSLQSDYFEVPSIIKLDDVALVPIWVVIFTKSFQDATDQASGFVARARAFIYNSMSGQYLAYGALTGAPYTAAEVGAVGVDEWDMDVTDNFTFYIHDEQKLINFQHTINAADSAIDDRGISGEFGALVIEGGGDVLPPYIIRQILTNSVFGLGYTDSQIDEESYDDAILYCETENIRVSTAYYREEGALRIIELLLSLYGGFLVISGGVIKFGRQQVEDAVRTIDNHRLIREGNDTPVKITRGAKQDTANKVKVNYIDRALEYRQNFVEIADEVDIDINGVRAREFPPQFVMSEATARKLAVRALWSGLYARDQYQFKLGPKDSDLEPGDVITLQDSFHPELSSGVYTRIVQMNNTKPGLYECVGVTEYAEYNSTSLQINSSSNINQNILFGPAKAPLDFRMYELPKEFQGANAQLFAGWVPHNFAMGARLYASPDNVTFAKVADVQPYIIAGRLDSQLNSHDGIDQNVVVHLFPNSPFDVASPTYCMTHALDDVSQAGRAIGSGLVWIGSEMVAYQGVTLLSQNKYRFDKVYRGWGGTYIHDHSVGDYWWKHGGGVFTQGYNEDKIGTTLYYKIVPYNFAGVEYNVSSIDAKSYQILGTYHRPQNCPALHTYLDTPTIGTRSEDLSGLSFKAVTSGGCKVYFDWSDASRMEGWGQGGYGNSTYGHFASDTTSHSWRVEVSSSNGFVVRSVSVSTTYYEYDRPVNSADFNGWNGAFTVRVTPYNTYGDALVSGVKSLNLFG